MRHGLLEVLLWERINRHRHQKKAEWGIWPVRHLEGARGRGKSWAEVDLPGPNLGPS